MFAVIVVKAWSVLRHHQAKSTKNSVLKNVSEILFINLVKILTHNTSQYFIIWNHDTCYIRESQMYPVMLEHILTQEVSVVTTDIQNSVFITVFNRCHEIKLCLYWLSLDAWTIHDTNCRCSDVKICLHWHSCQKRCSLTVWGAGVLM